MTSPLWISLLTLGAFAAACVLTWGVRRWAWHSRLLDVPNERSSHRVPMPRGGGVAIVICCIVALALLAAGGEVSTPIAVALIFGGLPVAAIGFIDDRGGVPAWTRLIVHVACAVGAIWSLGGLPPIQLGARIVDLGWTGDLLGVIGIIGVVNLFNFMDGIDGIAATEAAFMATAGGVLALVAGATNGVPATSFVLAAATCGFLIWNWPPAKIFMGDVGSGYLGYVIAVLAVAATHQNPAALFVWLILGAAFFVDALVTLVRRLARRERFYEAHRTHAYQWLSRRWGSHRSVTLTFLAVNICWLLPLAWYANSHPERSTWVAATALLPLVAIAVVAGAGRPESPERSRENQSNG